VALPCCRIFVDPDEGHHFFRRRLDEILEVLLRRGPAGEAASPSASVARRQRHGRP
jgi:hypothetical protein